VVKQLTGLSCHLHGMVSGVGRGMAVLDGLVMDRERGMGSFGVNLRCAIIISGDFLA